jgi:hypothetical protein
VNYRGQYEQCTNDRRKGKARTKGRARIWKKQAAARQSHRLTSGGKAVTTKGKGIASHRAAKAVTTKGKGIASHRAAKAVTTKGKGIASHRAAKPSYETRLLRQSYKGDICNT